MESRFLYSLDQVAEMTGLSARWLADRCRADKIDHENIQDSRRMSLEQIDILLEQHRVRPKDEEVAAQTRLQARLAIKKQRRSTKG